MEARRVVSAGGVICRAVDGRFEVALISRGSVWCLPKGLVEQAETSEEAALREVREETGLEGKLVGKIGEISYSFVRSVSYLKTVHFYLMMLVGGSMNDHDSEVDRVQWFPMSEAFQVLAYPNERRILGKAEDMLKQGE